MKVFHCDHCQQLVFFENTVCTNCHRLLAYLPELQAMASLEQGQDGSWSSPWAATGGRRYRLCQNYNDQGICNWAIGIEDSNPLCQSCRLTHIIPNLSRPGSAQSWQKLEAAKRRIVYGLKGLGLVIRSRLEDPQHGLAFEFLSDADSAPGKPALTGHNNGLITINIAEADDAERERRRAALHEPYRTLLGHFRHEIGHYFWDLLIPNSPQLEPFRQLFGDERADYAQALQRHYDNGAPPLDWQQQYVSAYATTHPWEDWAETWAHYLHMTDSLETAAACGLSLLPRRQNEPALDAAAADPSSTSSFERLIQAWFPVTYVMNNLNRGMGLPDAYPFVLSPPAIEKLRFIHQVIAGAAQRDAAHTTQAGTGASGGFEGDSSQPDGAPMPPPAAPAREALRA
jgi:hypothetical protein